MGDAGPPTPLPEEQEPSLDPIHIEQTRDVHVLVTGFGPFKSFNVNPSWLIASALPKELEPLTPFGTKDTQAQPPPIPPHYPFTSLLQRNPATAATEEDAQQPLRATNAAPYRIIVHTYTSPVRVAYTPTAALIPSLLNPATSGSHLTFDYVFHIGLASGRDSYTLETTAHRDGYVIADIDDGTAEAVSNIWARQDVPETLHVGWNAKDVLSRWEQEVSRKWEDEYESTAAVKRQMEEQARARASAAEEERNAGGVRNWMASHGMLLRPSSTPQHSTQSSLRIPRKPVVKLSRDAGRFLCEFILMCSLVQRYLAAQHERGRLPTPAEVDVHHAALEQVGKVAFLHVPNGIEEADVKRGVLVAGSAIRSLVASWEEGWRNPAVYTVTPLVGDVTERAVPVVDRGSPSTVPVNGFESRGTGDAS